MRKFSSYGPPNAKIHYCVPRKELVATAFKQLVGDNPEEGGHYITVWAPRQRGKSWIMQQITRQLKDSDLFEVGMITLQSAKSATTVKDVLKVLTTELQNWFERPLPTLSTWQDLREVFTKNHFKKPVILILDEFDSLNETFINEFVNELRSIYTNRQDEWHKPSAEKNYLLHGVALIGVRSVLGIENKVGSPFNVQRSLHIPNLRYDEVQALFKQYEEESKQVVEQAVIDRLFYETGGQPGLISWFGELLTETYNKTPTEPITLKHFRSVYGAAIYVLPNNNVVNIISKAKQEPYQQMVLELFKTTTKIRFAYDDKRLNFLYMNGVIDWEKEDDIKYYAKFPCPFVQKRLFNYFSHTLFREMNDLYDPFNDLDDVVTENSLHIPNLMQLYGRYLHKNKGWLLNDVPRRTDMKPYEAIYHFSLYMYLSNFLQQHGGQVIPEFPTGNGKIDLIINYAGQTYGLELKSYVSKFEYNRALTQAARYGQRLQLLEVFLVFFVAAIDEANRTKLEVPYNDEKTGVKVIPVFVATGE